MNQRIQELAQMCWEELDEEEGYYPEFNPKKFAELIVAECVSLMEWQKISPKDDGAYNSALSLAQRNIKEHFGLDS